MNNYSIEKATITDLQGVKALMLKALQLDPYAFSSDYQDYAVNNDAWWYAYLNRYLTQNYANLIVAKVDDKIVGMIGLLLDSKARHKHVASIVWFYVLPEYRGHKVGKTLIKEMLDYIRTIKEIKKVNLMVNSRQSTAITLYKALGFNTSGILKDEFLINGVYVDEMIMEKEI